MFAENQTEFFPVCVENLSENKQKRESRIRNRNRKIKLVTLRAQVYVAKNGLTAVSSHCWIFVVSRWFFT